MKYHKYDEKPPEKKQDHNDEGYVENKKRTGKNIRNNPSVFVPAEHCVEDIRTNSKPEREKIWPLRTQVLTPGTSLAAQ